VGSSWERGAGKKVGQKGGCIKKLGERLTIKFSRKKAEQHEGHEDLRRTIARKIEEKSGGGSSKETGVGGCQTANVS